jgi:hypothetical protein
LRGGGTSITVKINNQDLTIEGGGTHTPVEGVYLAIYQKYPFLKDVKFNLFIKGKLLDKKKTIGFYEQSKFEVTTDIPSYLFGAEGIVKKMKTNG